MVNWSEQLDDFGRRILEELGENPDFLPRDYNPITKALSEPNKNFVQVYSHLKGFNRTSLCRVATICQMVVFDHEGGPEGDGKPKALRRHWYSWFKTRFAQPLSQQLGEDLQSERWGLNWAARLSTTYAEYVDGGNATYQDLWVEDASRMMQRIYDVLFKGCHIIVAVEKDSLFKDFVAPARALGARTVYSGKGKSSKAGIEKVLREHFAWRDGNGPFNHRDKLIILHVSDWDFDGEAVIGPTFGEQASRYSDYILEARVGINPETVVELGNNPADDWYQVKLSNKGYVKWANKKALFMATCQNCQNDWAVVGTFEQSTLHDHKCPECGGLSYPIDVNVSKAHGYEVEALKTRDYYGLLVDALLQVLPFDYIVQRLREECTADSYQAAEQVAQAIYEQNDDYQKILSEFQRLEKIKTEFENRIKNTLDDLGRPHISDWQYDDLDPEPDEFRSYVQNARDYSMPWRPFDRGDRTKKLVEWLRDNEEETISEFKTESLL